MPNLTASFSPTGPNRNIVTFVDRGWPYDDAVIAVTTNAFDSKTGVIFDSDVEINDEYFALRLAADDGSGCSFEDGEMDLRNTLTHEVGHMLGLDHPPGTRAYRLTTMYASAPSCEVQKRTLETDDIAGVCFIYPTGAATQQCFEPEGAELRRDRLRRTASAAVRRPRSHPSGSSSARSCSFAVADEHTRVADEAARLRPHRQHVEAGGVATQAARLGALSARARHGRHGCAGGSKRSGRVGHIRARRRSRASTCGAPPRRRSAP